MSDLSRRVLLLLLGSMAGLAPDLRAEPGGGPPTLPAPQPMAGGGCTPPVMPRLLASARGAEMLAGCRSRRLAAAQVWSVEGDTSLTFTPVATGTRPPLWRRSVLASAALAATGALIGHLSSHRAEKAYDRYLGSAGSRRREEAFAEAERYDRIAGAGFLVMEAGLVLTAYFLFF